MKEEFRDRRFSPFSPCYLHPLKLSAHLEKQQEFQNESFTSQHVQNTSDVDKSREKHTHPLYTRLYKLHSTTSNQNCLYSQSQTPFHAITTLHVMYLEKLILTHFIPLLFSYVNYLVAPYFI